MNKRGSVWKIILIIGIVLSLIVAVYFTFFFYYKCEDMSCFKAKQAKCAKVTFINELKSTTWFYKINGKEDNKCAIEAGILQVKEGNLDSKRLEGKTMECFLNIGSISPPESDLTICHGRLKEEIQEIMIKNTHSEILSNLEGQLKGVL